MRPPTKTLRIFSALSFISVSLCLQQFSLQKATAQGSIDKDTSGQSAQTKREKTWPQPHQSGWKPCKWKQIQKVSKSLPPITEAVVKPAATGLLTGETLGEKTLVDKSLVDKSLVEKPLVTKELVTKPLVTSPVARNQPSTKSFGARPALNRPVASSHAAPNYVNKAAREAEKKIQDHDLAAAVNIWSTEIEARPENADSWVGRASVKRMIGDYHGAHDDLDRALDLNANSVPALISRAAVLRRLADLRGAAKDIDRAVELAPKSYQAFAERSSLRFALNDMQGAMADYNYAITLNPDLNKQVAKYSYSANSQPPIAIRDARDVSKPDGRPEAKAGAAHKTAENKVAENKAGESKSVESKTVEYKAGDNKNLADNKSNEAGDAPITSAELAHMNNTAVHEINAKHFAVAIKTFERLLEISPNYAHAKDNLVIAHNNFGLELSMRQPKEALKQFRAALYLDPRQAAIRKNLSAIMRENGQDPSSTEDRLAMANECLSQGEAEGAFVELSEALRIKNTPQLREKLLVALAAINSNDSNKANHPTNQKEKLEAKLEAKLETKPEARLEVKEESSKTTNEPDMAPPTILGTILPAIPESRSAMTTIANLPHATIRNREPMAMRPVRAAQDNPPATAAPLESPSATPGYDAAFVKSTLDNTPEIVLQVARQLASENRELDAEALLNRLCELLRKKSLKGDKAAEQMLELTLETLSELYFKSNRLQNAEPTLRELVAIREKTKSPDDHILGKTLAEYSMVLKTLGRTEEASKQEQKANFILNQLSAH